MLWMSPQTCGAFPSPWPHEVEISHPPTPVSAETLSRTGAAGWVEPCRRASAGQPRLWTLYSGNGQ